jgi:hypothetical protein
LEALELKGSAGEYRSRRFRIRNAVLKDLKVGLAKKTWILIVQEISDYDLNDQETDRPVRILDAVLITRSLS